MADQCQGGVTMRGKALSLLPEWLGDLVGGFWAGPKLNMRVFGSLALCGKGRKNLGKC